MNSQMRTKKASLLSRVSTLAVIAAAGSFGAAQQAQAACTTTFEVPADGTTVNTNTTCVVVNAPVTGDVTNEALVGDPGPGFIPFSIEADVSGSVINNGNIFGGYFDGGENPSEAGALTISNEATVGAIVNNLAITSTSGNGIQIGQGGENGGHILNGITNTDDISSGGRYGIAALYGDLSGGLTNQSNATISGGLAAIFVADTFGPWAGDITNSGQLSGLDAAIQLGDGGENPQIVFNGGIVNNFGGVIDSLGGTAIVITNDVSAFTGGITNSGEIEGADNGIIINAGTFSGGFTNNAGGVIEGLSGDAIQSSAGTWSGNFTNSGQISAALDGFEYVGTTFTGDVQNSGNITAGFSGIRLSAETFAGNVTNTGSITATNGSGLAIVATDISAGGEIASQIRNTGIIDAGFVGVRISGETVLADFTNNSIDPALFPPGQISSESAAAVVLAASTSWQGDITNAGTLTGLHGMIVNGFSDGFSVFSSDGTYTGTITNSGRMEGDVAGLFISGSSFDGTLINSGQLISTTTEGTTAAAGLVIGTGTWSGNITNTSTGLIQGVETGALIQTNTFTGLITNDGVITGFGLDTGLHIVTTGTHTGDIVNNNLISASGNALHVEIGTHVGSIINTGTIEATISGNTAALLEVDSGTTFVNTGGGLVLGDIVFGGKAAYDFVGEDGGVEGQLFGLEDNLFVNDDVITVQDGTHYFYFTGKGAGILNFASLNVDDGGTAVLGARFVGDPTSAPFSTSNIDNVNVNDGGTLYIGQGTTLTVDNAYTQDSTGTLMFYLGAPSGLPSASGTVTADPGDYGQVVVGGTATLNGVIAGFLDDDFGAANPDVDVVEYNDVITADAISGDFTTLALLNSNSIWELDSIIDGTTVDLRVQRTADVGHIGNVPGIVVETAGPWKSMVNDRSNGIGSGSCGLAGPGSCFNRFAQAGAGQVMSDATPGADPFEWLRTGVRRVGETAAWGRAVGVWGETDGDVTLGAPGTDFDMVGGIAGIDHVFTPTLLAGLAAQYTQTDIDFNGLPDNAEVDSWEVGAYMSWGDTRLYLNANTSIIFHDIEVNRFGIGTQALGDYDGTTYSAYAEAGKIFETDSGFRIQPLIALSFAHLDTDAYSETGTGTLLDVFESDFESLKSMVGARFAYPIPLQSGRRLVPEARVVWAHEFLDDQSAFLADIQGGPVTPSLIVGEEYSRETVIVGTGITAPLSDETSLFIDYDAGLNDDITTHTVSGGFRTRW